MMARTGQMKRMAMMVDLIIFLAGVACAVAGGELFVRGTVSFGRRARISPALLSMTLAALATSSPELSVSIGAALLGRPAVGFGDVLGSNVLNIALVLGLGLVMRARGVAVPPGILRRDYPVALLIPLVTWFFVSDGVVVTGEGLVLLSAFFLWASLSLGEAIRHRSPAVEPGSQERLPLLAGQLLAGLGLLIAAGDLVVTGAKGLALNLGVHEFVIGAVVVSFGTSMPELATVVVSRLRGHDEVGFGTVLGSNILNGLLVAGIASTITPIRVEPREAGVALFFSVACLLVIWPGRTLQLGRRRGIVLLAVYLLWNILLLAA